MANMHVTAVLVFVCAASATGKMSHCLVILQVSNLSISQRYAPKSQLGGSVHDSWVGGPSGV